MTKLCIAILQFDDDELVDSSQPIVFFGAHTVDEKASERMPEALALLARSLVEPAQRITRRMVVGEGLHLEGGHN